MTKYITLFLITMLSVSAYSQKSPVAWNFELEKISSNEYIFKALATIQNHWNIYSKDMGSDGPIPTSVNFESYEGAELTGSLEENCNVIKSFDELFEMDVMKIKDKATYTQKIKISKPGVLKGFVNFMCCDQERCLPPTNVPFELKF